MDGGPVRRAASDGRLTGHGDRMPEGQRELECEPTMGMRGAYAYARLLLCGRVGDLWHNLALAAMVLRIGWCTHDLLGAEPVPRTALRGVMRDVWDTKG